MGAKLRLFQDGFESGDGSKWSNIECPEGFSVEPGSMEGVFRGKFKVAPGQHLPGATSERCEVRTGMGLFPPEAERWMRWYTHFPQEFVPTPNSVWNIFNQLHQKPGLPGSPNVESHVNTGLGDPFLELYIKGGMPAVDGVKPTWKLNMGPLVRGVNRRFVIGIKLSATLGFVKVFVDDQKLAEREVPTLYSDDDQGLYLKGGYYRGPTAPGGPITTIYHDGFVVGESYADVA